MSGTFDQLNEALFAQLEKLQSVPSDDKDKMDQTIEQTKAVSQLAVNIINNTNSAINAMKFYEMAGMDAGGLMATAPKMLGGK